MSRLAGKVALVTGGSRGLGKGICLRLARAGADLVIHGYDPYDKGVSTAGEVAEAIRGMGRRALAVQADVSSAKEVEAMVAQALEAFGRIDSLVACAGMMGRVSIFDMTEAQWHRMLSVTLKGAFLAVKAVLPAMRAQGHGKIIFISSDAGKEGAKVSGPHYSAAKGGILGLRRGLARQLAPYNINVNDVCPMDIPVERWGSRSPEDLAAILKEIPLGRFGSPDDIGAAIEFLLSDDANHITGASIDVNGGAMIR